MYALVLVDWFSSTATVVGYMAELDHCRIFAEEFTRQISESTVLTYECIEKEMENTYE